MPKKRTKQQKMRAQYHYALPSAHSFSGIPSDVIKQKSGLPRANRLFDETSLYHYDPRLIRTDITRTMAISAIILMIQMVLYIGLK